MILTRIPGLEWIGRALINSIWQFGLLSLLYIVITGGDKRYTAAIRHNIALAFSMAGSTWFVTGLARHGVEMPSLPVTMLPVLMGTESPFIPAWSQLVFLFEQMLAFIPYLYMSLLLLRAAIAFRGTTLKSRMGTPFAIPPFAESKWKSFLDGCRRELRIGRPVLLRWTAGRGMALTRGFLRPVVFFPVGLLNRLTADQVEAILVHELAHIRRNDYLAHLWISFFRFVFYFNPFARFLYDAVCRERELACDDLVLRCAYPAAEYARALMTLEAFRQSQTPLSLAAGGHRPMHLADRIRRICGIPGTPRRIQPVVRLTGLLLISSLAVFALRPVRNKEESPREKATGPAPAATVILKKPAAVEALAEVAPAAPVFAAVPLPELTFAGKEKNNSPQTRMRIPPHRASAPDGNEQPPPAETDSSDEWNAEPGAPEVVSDEPAFASGKITRNFSYRSAETAPVPVPSAGFQPYVPSSSFEYLVADTVPMIALQSLQENKPAVLQLLAGWKLLQWQQRASRTLELQYQKLKEKQQKELQTIPAKKAELKKALEHLKEEMQKRKAEIDRLSALLADGPVIYI